MTPLRCHFARRSAFTLIEVLVVVTILGVAAMVVVPNVFSPGSLTIQAAARLVVSDLLYAQNEAVARQSAHQVIFNPTGNSYRLADAAGQTIHAPWRGGAYHVNFTTDGRFDGVQITAVDFGGGTQVTFDEMGAPSSGGTIDLKAGDNHYRITVTAFTGRVTVGQVATGG